MLLENMLFENATNDSNDFFKEKSKDYKIIKEDVRKYIYKIGRETTRVYGPDELGRHTSIIEIAKRRIGKKAKGEVIGFIDNPKTRAYNVRCVIEASKL